MDTPHQVYRDGEPVSPVLESENAAYGWLHRNQGNSVDHATRHEGYAIVAVDGGAA